MKNRNKNIQGEENPVPTSKPKAGRIVPPTPLKDNQPRVGIRTEISQQCAGNAVVEPLAGGKSDFVGLSYLLC